MSTYVEYLTANGIRAEPGLDAKAVEGLERALRARLPDQVRELYGTCGGLRSKHWTSMPMRLMRPKETVQTAEILKDSADVYQPHRDARYLFTDDGSNWAGVFVKGPLTGNSRSSTTINRTTLRASAICPASSRS
jgi:hypothetical protein